MGLSVYSVSTYQVISLFTGNISNSTATYTLASAVTLDMSQLMPLPLDPNLSLTVGVTLTISSTQGTGYIQLTDSASNTVLGALTIAGNSSTPPTLNVTSAFANLAKGRRIILVSYKSNTGGVVGLGAVTVTLYGVTLELSQTIDST